MFYDGQSNILYWADACSEIAFVVPSPNRHAGCQSENLQSVFNTSNLSCTLNYCWFVLFFFYNNLLAWYDQNLPENNPNREKRALSLDLDKQPAAPTRRSGNRHHHPHMDTKIMVVWLESYEDHLTLPIGLLRRS